MTKNCAICGKPFELTRPNRLYCSRDCTNAANRKRMKEKREREKALEVNLPRELSWLSVGRRRLAGEKICMFCEAPTEGNNKFCSDECLLQFYDKLFGSLGERGY